jgi:hypothetical protein
MGFCLSSLAYAQSAPAQSAAESRAIFYAGPEAGFDPVTASDPELAHYGFPPRPDQSQPTLYGHWKKMVTANQKRLTNLTVQTTRIINGTARNRRDGETVGNVTATSSENWSGYAVTAANGTFTANNSYVLAEWSVPGVGVDNCAYAPYASSQWVGFDGAFFSADVLQVGTATNACPTSYVAWYEWYTTGCTSSSATLPCYQTNISMAINPGDLVLAEVWYTTAAPNGHAFIEDYTSQQSASIGFSQPLGSSGSAYLGNTVEWVVERPGLVGGGIEDLANYVSVPMNFTYAYDGASYFYPEDFPSGATSYAITMTCPTWNPSSLCPSTQELSYPEMFGMSSLWFYDVAPAYQ